MADEIVSIDVEMEPFGAMYPAIYNCYGGPQGLRPMYGITIVREKWMPDYLFEGVKFKRREEDGRSMYFMRSPYQPTVSASYPEGEERDEEAIDVLVRELLRLDAMNKSRDQVFLNRDLTLQVSRQEWDANPKLKRAAGVKLVLHSVEVFL